MNQPINTEIVTPDLLDRAQQIPEAALKLRALIHSDASLMMIKGQPVAFGDAELRNPETEIVVLLGALVAALPVSQRIEFLRRAVAVVKNAQGAMPTISVAHPVGARTH